MSFFKRLFSSDHRAALTAEAAGDFELAAERYALAGQHDAAVRMHMARAERAKTRADEVDALRDALHWAREEASIQVASKALGKALLAQAQAEGVKTERDRERVRDAAAHLVRGRLYEHAGDAFASVDDGRAAAEAYRSGGLVGKLELALAMEQDKQDQARAERSDFADYELHMLGGSRDEALRALRECLEGAESRSSYRRLLDDLESRVITGGNLRLKTRRGKVFNFCSAREIVLGRDSLCDLVLRTGGVSRQHASIFVSKKADKVLFELADAGSRNGTSLGGHRFQDRLPLSGKGVFQLGEDLEIHFTVQASAPVLTLEVRKGLDNGAHMRVAPDGELMGLEAMDVTGHIYFRDGRPTLRHPGTEVSLNGEHIAHGDVQLIHGDSIKIGDVELEVD